jgi:hypothetical protein
MSPIAHALCKRETTCSTAVVVAATVIATIAGCIEVPAREGTTSAGPALTSLRVQGLVLAADSNVVELKYEIVPVACDDGHVLGAPRTKVRPLDTKGVSAVMPSLSGAPFDNVSAHRASELLEVVPAGCYDVMVTPLLAGGAPSTGCGPARKDRVEVLEGKTTDVFLLGQCQGHDPGALDILAALNHAPEIVDLSTPGSASLGCGAPTLLCASGKDVDSDPLEFELKGPASCSIEAAQPESTRHCWTLNCRAGAASLALRVYDLALRDGELVRIEDWYAAEGRQDESHAQAAFELRFTGIDHWPDADADGYGDAKAPAVTLCTGDDARGLSTNDADCNDGDPRIRPGAPEICGDRTDNDCDGVDCAGCTTAFSCADGPMTTARCSSCADPATGGFCFQVAEGGTFCSDDFWCAGKATCVTSRDCALSEVCLVQTCCAGTGQGVCTKAKLECSVDDTGVSQQAKTALGTATGRR